MRRGYEFLLILLVGIFVYIAIESAENKIMKDGSSEFKTNNVDTTSH
tara:strand:- start:1294 stop:1434 length:141 start_codon:yes stop_codon:yes gene_type:complete